MHKFRALHEQYPWLVDVIDPLGYKRHNPKTYSIDEEKISLLRDFVRHQLDYIAFRPWFSIDPYSPKGWYDTSTSLEYELRCDTYYGGTPGAVYEVEWMIVWKVGNRKYSTSPHHEGLTLVETMTTIKIEYLQGHFGEGKLSFDFVAKHIVEANSRNGFQKMSIELVKVPENIFLPIVHAKSPLPHKMRESELLEYRRTQKSDAFDDVRLLPQVEVMQMAAAA